jgi:LPPG:FO 2-phospho-L-lactate transferase
VKKITVLSGGVGGARFIQGLLAHLGDDGPPAEVTVIVNTGDDMWLNGLRVCPDLDTMMYTLGGGIDEGQGWGRSGESRRTSAEIAAYGRGWPWFTLGDLDLATHIVRSELLREGRTLSEATRELADRWKPGARLLPMSDDPVETHVRLADFADEHRAGDLIHFEEWWVRYRACLRVEEFLQLGIDEAAPAPGVLDSIRSADVVILPPSNPVVSIGTILAVPGVREAVRTAPGTVIGISPLINGGAVRGMADACLQTVGVDTSALAVGLHYGARGSGGVLDGWLVDTSDAEAVRGLRAAGLLAEAVPLWMSDASRTAALASAALALAIPGQADSIQLDERPRHVHS